MPVHWHLSLQDEVHKFMTHIFIIKANGLSFINRNSMHKMSEVFVFIVTVKITDYITCFGSTTVISSIVIPSKPTQKIVNVHA